MDAEHVSAKHRGPKRVAVLVGLASLAWFLFRVVPKPSRAAYPCQRAAAPLAGGFLLWLAGLIGLRALGRRMRDLSQRHRWAVAAAVLAMAVTAVWLPLGLPMDATAQEAFTPSEPPNQPMGVGKGIHPGRVVWAYDPEAARWDGQTGQWWDDANTDAGRVDQMVSGSVRSLAGRRTDQQAWAALFRHFNETRGLGKNGYRRGEKVAVKINANQDRGGEWGAARGMPSPHVVYALVAQLVTAAGVPAEDITVYDASRYIGDPIYKKVKASFPGVQFVVTPALAKEGRMAAAPDPANPVRFADPALREAQLPQCVTAAKYLINLALLRPHTLFGVTLTAKNHFGSTYFADRGRWTPQPLHNCGSRDRPMGSYNCLVELIGHRHLGGKTLLYMLDGLYPAEHNEGRVFRFASLGDRWAASLLASQDPVAIDSVALDLLRSEPRATQVRGNPDNYLHEAALANKPPSGTVYDPERDGQPLASLGVHEHWNNPSAKQYSRNLGKTGGIELVRWPEAPAAGTTAARGGFASPRTGGSSKGRPPGRSSPASTIRAGDGWSFRTTGPSKARSTASTTRIPAPCPSSAWVGTGRRSGSRATPRAGISRLSSTGRWRTRGCG